MKPTSATSIGERLRRERKRLNWSQKDLAAALEPVVSTMSINRWEHDKALPQNHYRKQLCSLFKKSNDELFSLLAGETDGASARPLQWNVPYRRNLYFTGRDGVLTRLHEILSTQKTVALTALSGMGGIGKTQTAVEYAFRYCEEYEAVLWVRADTSQTLASDFVLLADLLDLPEKQEVEQRKVVGAVLRWLHTHQGWLLILDNVDDFELISEFLPTRGTGQLLITTRSSATGSTIKGIELDTMAREEGTLLLLRRAKILNEDELLEQAAADERTAAEALCALADGLPLALDQAGAYIEENHCSIADYLQLYRLREADLIKRLNNVGRRDYPHTVATTWALSFERVAHANPAAADLLRLCAFLHPDAIFEAMLLAGGAELGPVLQPLASDLLLWDEAIGALRKYSLVRRTAKTKQLNMHRLMQVVLKEAMDVESYGIWAERAVRVVNRAFPEAEVATWSTCQMYLPHAQTCAELMEQEDMCFPEAAQLLQQMGAYLYQSGLYAEAKWPLKRALEIREQILGPEHPLTAESSNNLALLYRAQGQYTLAEPLHRRALSIHERLLGPEHPDTVLSLNHLAVIYRRLGQYADAEPLYWRALTIRERTLGADHPLSAETLDNLGVLYYSQGRYEEAEPLLKRALTIHEQVLGPQHPFSAHSLDNLAFLYQLQGKYAQAEPLCQQALRIRELVLGPEHPHTTFSIDNLAEIYRKQGQYHEAERLFERVLAVRERLLGPEHPDTALSLYNLAILHSDQGHYGQAESFFHNALAVRERVLGPDHPETASILHKLALLYRDQGQSEQSETLFQRLLSSQEQHSFQYPELASALEDYVALLRSLERETEAVVLEARTRAMNK